MAFTEDLSLFFAPAEFGDTALLTPNGGGAGTAGTVLFDVDGLVLDQYDVQSQGPTALAPATQWPGVREGDHLAVQHATGSKYFRVRAVTPLSDGAICLLALARTTALDTARGTFYVGDDAVLLQGDYINYAAGSAQV